MDDNIFSGLEDLGFDNADKIDIFSKEEEKAKDEKEEKAESKEDKVRAALYDKEINCPVCGNVFKIKAVKASHFRILKKDSDFFIHYAEVNPYLYDVWLCPICGYADMKADFPKIKEFQKDLIRINISQKWKGKKYPEMYDGNIAIERYKLALLNSTIYKADSSKKAMNCLKIAWMYRLIKDSSNEILFLKQAVAGFNDAFLNERFPIYGMDEGTMMYLIGEMYRRIGDNGNAMSWFSRLITTPGTDQKIKDKARDQKDLIKDGPLNTDDDDSDDDSEDESEATSIQIEDKPEKQKKGFFKFFK